MITQQYYTKLITRTIFFKEFSPLVLEQAMLLE